MDELEQIRQKIDIVSLISEYLPLKKAGRNFRINCPFHNEKTPSFTVSPERQIFHCFGCSVGGDIFTFLMKYESLEFPEALQILASRAGVILKRKAFDNKLSKTKERLYQINHLASELYHYLLTSHPSGKKALDYLKKRAITPGSVKTFKLGFIPNLPDTLIKFLVGKKKYLLSELSDAGLVVAAKDRFRNRIIFPLMDHRGNIVGFSGRILEGEGQAKYINTPETVIYHKGDLFYGLNIAREAIKEENSALVVEGEFDVIQAMQHGIKNVVAIKGTALTANQANLLGRFTENIKLCLDKDSAGQLANKRGIEILENANLAVTVINLPAGKDPDESLQKNPLLFKKAVRTPVPIYDFIIDTALSSWNSKEPIGKKKISDEVIPFLAKITNEIIKNHYIKKLANILEVSEEAVINQITKVEKKEFTSTVATPQDVKKDKKDREEILAEYLLALIIQSPSPNIFKDKLQQDLFIMPLYQQIFGSLCNFLIAQKFSIKKFIQFVPPELVPAIDRSFLLLLPTDLTEDQYLVEVQKTIIEIRTLVVRKKMREVAGKIKAAEIGKNAKELTLLHDSFEKLTNKLSSFDRELVTP